MSKEKVEELAGNHWEFINGLLGTLNKEKPYNETFKYLYLQAFIHGFRHGQEEIGDKNE